MSPIPSPRSEEPKKTFISRCMSDSVMNKEFPDIKQRNAVCYRQWRAKELMKLSSKYKEEKMANKDETGPRSGSRGPRDGRGQGRGRAGGKGVGKRTGGKRGDC